MGGLTRPTKGTSPAERFDSQNQTVYLLPPNLVFGFRVTFDNLRPEELGALLFALTLQAPARWNAPAAGEPSELMHMLGHGKPLGMGSCSIAVERLHLDSFDPADPNHRYARIPTFQSPPSGGVEAPPHNPAPAAAILEYLERFDQSWEAAEARSPDLGHVRNQLVEMLSQLGQGDRVHYPPAWDARDLPIRQPRHYENFRWFVANRRGSPKHGRYPRHEMLPRPEDERTKTEKRLPFDPTDP